MWEEAVQDLSVLQLQVREDIPAFQTAPSCPNLSDPVAFLGVHTTVSDHPIVVNVVKAKATPSMAVNLRCQGSSFDYRAIPDSGAGASIVSAGRWLQTP